MLLTDAIVSLQLSENFQAEHVFVMHKLVRSSVMSSCFFLEGVANLCVDSLDFSKSRREEHDKMTVFSKFDFFVQAQEASKRIDYSDARVGKAMQLVRIRNDFVHPKIGVRRIGKVEGKPGVRMAAPKQYGNLSIHDEPLFWGPSFAVEALQVVTSFLEYLFLEVARLTPEQSKLLLCHGRRTDELDKNLLATTPVFSSEGFDDDGMKVYCAEKGISLGFLLPTDTN